MHKTSVSATISSAVSAYHNADPAGRLLPSALDKDLNMYLQIAGEQNSANLWRNKAARSPSATTTSPLSPDPPSGLGSAFRARISLPGSDQPSGLGSAPQSPGQLPAGACTATRHHYKLIGFTSPCFGLPLGAAPLDRPRGWNWGISSLAT